MSAPVPPRAGAGEAAVRVVGVVASLAYAAVLAWLIVGQPRTVAEVRGGLTSQVGLYRVDRESFDQGLRFFREDRFPEARLAFSRADGARRDPTTQFYVAYSYYRQGWGRLYNDDMLFREALAALDRAVEMAGGSRIIVEDPSLGLPTSDELRAELDRGLTTDVSDLNPLRVLRERK
jgi:hypothetical protein